MGGKEVIKQTLERQGGSAYSIFTKLDEDKNGQIDEAELIKGLSAYFKAAGMVDKKAEVSKPKPVEKPIKKPT